tara:strand:- start:776 stop:1663 length:888 start_codon:yes stop_codon:yes gene_type:complete
MTKYSTPCICCENSSYRTVFEGTIRSGSYGNITDEKYCVIECEKCKLKFLNPKPPLDYESEEYRELYNGTSAPQDYLKLHDHEQNERLVRIGVENFRNKIVLDFGCGGGSFLDCIKGLCQKTIGIEPCRNFHQDLKSRGHEIFSYAEEALEKYAGRIDILISFGVIEHTDDPLSYLKVGKSLLSDDGTLFLETDNYDDFLMKLDLHEFKQFFYRTAHNWYFDSRSMENALASAGFTSHSVEFRHNYDLSNAFLWMNERKPTGNGKIDNISESLNLSWKNFLEQTGQADLIFCRAS